jgi:hypothetical protein
MTVNTRVIKYTLKRAEVPYVEIRSGLRLQVIPDFEALPFCQRGQSAAFIASTQMLVVWQDEPKLLLERSQLIINSLMRMMCGQDYGWLGDDELDIITGKTMLHDIAEYEDTLEAGDTGEEQPRELKLWQSFYTGVSVLLLTLAIGSGWRQIAVEQILEPNWLRLLFIVCLPAQACLSLVSFFRGSYELPELTDLVLLSSHCRHHRTNHWA